MTTSGQARLQQQGNGSRMCEKLRKMTASIIIILEKNITTEKSKRFLANEISRLLGIFQDVLKINVHIFSQGTNRTPGEDMLLAQPTWEINSTAVILHFVKGWAFILREGTAKSTSSANFQDQAFSVQPQWAYSPDVFDKLLTNCKTTVLKKFLRTRGVYIYMGNCLICFWYKVAKHGFVLICPICKITVLSTFYLTIVIQLWFD